MSGSTVALDTSVLVAALQSWHSEHERAQKAVARALRTGSAVVPIHVLFESYSVLTRMPKPRRLSPATALALLDRTLADRVKFVHLEALSALDTLRSFAEQDLAGGVTYDALVATAAFQGGARTLLTLNSRDFRRAAPEGLEIRSP